MGIIVADSEQGKHLTEFTKKSIGMGISNEEWDAMWEPVDRSITDHIDDRLEDWAYPWRERWMRRFSRLAVRIFGRKI